MLRDQKTIIIVCGPTAVGKTNLAIQLAQHFHTEIISADSRQCFRELNIGVAKPSAEELATIHHHFINSHSIHEEVNAATFEAYALNAANEIFQKNEIAIMVGGTGLYIKAFTEGLDDIPAIDAATRQLVLRDYEAFGLSFLQSELQEKDPAFWQVAEQQNPQRLMRALEVLRATGKSILHFRKGEKQQRNFNIVKIGLELPREQLYAQINHRVDEMMNAGQLEEAQRLFEYRRINALQTVGYRELFAYFNGEVDLQTAVETIKKNTRHYAKRQLTWFKRDLSIQWFNPYELSLITQILRRLG